jgi:SAM-dependent methyltransferase
MILCDVVAAVLGGSEVAGTATTTSEQYRHDPPVAGWYNPRCVFLSSLKTRQREEEWMDAPDIEPAAIQTSLSFIRQVNRMLGYTRSTIAHFKQFSRSWKPGERIRILDVATGSADIPRAVVRWGESAGFAIEAVGLDRHPLTSLEAQAKSDSDSQIKIVRGDALQLPFADGGFDYVMTNMFLHHLDEDAVVQVLREMNRVARRGIVAADLVRDRRAYAWITLFTLFASPIIRHDARVSVQQAFSKPEFLELCNRAGLSYATYTGHFGHRFVVAGQKSA